MLGSGGRIRWRWESRRVDKLRLLFMGVEGGRQDRVEVS